jgi:hypothetical protein
VNSTVVTALVLLASGLAGCVGGEAETSASTKDVDTGPAEFDESTGGIQGQVTDDELNPLANAQAGLQRSDVIQTDIMGVTDELGRFSLSNVPPGTHLLFVQAFGYEATARKVEVIVGQLAEVNVGLVPLPTDEPFHVAEIRTAAVTSVMVKATPSCIYNIGGQGSLAKTCQGQRRSCTPDPNCEVHYTKLLEKQQEAGNNFTTVIGEVTWTPQSGATGRGFLFDITAPNSPRDPTTGAIDQSNPHTFVKMQPKPPILWRIDPALLTERKLPETDWCCDWFYRLFGAYCDIESAAGLSNCETTPDVGIGVDAPGKVYMTWFFKEPAPIGWTALPDV